MNSTNSENLLARVLSRENLAEQIKKRRAENQKIVLANGCFDLFHVGHVRYLSGAKYLGDCLVVAINADAQVRRLKGKNRPFMPENERAEIIAALRFVDYVTIFDEPTVEELIRKIQPDFHAKGTDYTAESVPEKDAVGAYGGRVRIVGDPKNHSSTDLIEKVSGKQ